jgi:hypothetical protein
MVKTTSNRQNKNWFLYWVASDGFEDCFVVAKNSRSAKRIEYDMNGFDPDEVSALKIMRIPEAAARAYQRSLKYKEHPWPWYVYGKKFFKSIGADFRSVDGREEMLLDDVVYQVDEYIPCSIQRQRSIGFRAIEEFNSLPDLAFEINRHEEEDLWHAPEIHIVTALGICLIRCQQIEDYIAKSFLLGISKKQKGKFNTINDLRDGWKKKTLGNMLQSMQEAWEIDPTIKANLELFLENRNLLVHGITTSERYDIRTRWGQYELLSFLNFFDVHSRIVKRAFRASYFASIMFAIHHWGVPEGSPKRLLTKKHRDEASIFFEFFKPRDGEI